jgi:hypothetical protein
MQIYCFLNLQLLALFQNLLYFHLFILLLHYRYLLLKSTLLNLLHIIITLFLINFIILLLQILLILNLNYHLMSILNLQFNEYFIPFNYIFKLFIQFMIASFNISGYLMKLVIQKNKVNYLFYRILICVI